MTAIASPERKVGALALLPGTLLLLYGLIALGYLLAISWSCPVLDMFGFRQAQTAWSAYWIAKGGPLLAYQTPTTGYPWSIPFEFPIYQWLMAVLVDATGLTLDQTGRIVSVVFFLAAAATVYRIAIRLSSDRAMSIACAGAFVASPMAIFWARSVMIESTALYLSLEFVCQVIAFHQTRRTRNIVGIIFFAVCGALVKITTFYGFAAALSLVLVAALVRDFRTPLFRQTLNTCLIAGVAVVLALVALIGWVAYSDLLKQQSAIGGLLTSQHVSAFNYGTLKQRLDLMSWRDIIFGRSVHDVLGSRWILLASAIVLACIKKLRWFGALLLVGYLAPFMTFTNLHYVHAYYQFANFAFLTTIVGLAVGSLARKGPVGTGIATAAAVLIVGVSAVVLRQSYVPTITQDQAHNRVIELARFVRSHTSDDQGLMIFGLDWSSELPYYSLRKSVAVPNWNPPEALKALTDFRKDFGGQSLGALVVCPIGPAGKSAPLNPGVSAIVASYSQGRRSQVVSGCEVYF